MLTNTFNDDNNLNISDIEPIDYDEFVYPLLPQPEPSPPSSSIINTHFNGKMSSLGEQTPGISNRHPCSSGAHSSTRKRMSGGVKDSPPFNEFPGGLKSWRAYAAHKYGDCAQFQQSHVGRRCIEEVR
jgi:hypothetical protein